QARFGPSMQVVEELSTGEREAIAVLKRPSEKADSIGTHADPSMLDGAFQAMFLARTIGQGAGDLTVPFLADSITVYASLPDRCFVYVQHGMLSAAGIGKS